MSFQIQLNTFHNILIARHKAYDINKAA